jgi:hypothetical protein
MAMWTSFAGPKGGSEAGYDAISSITTFSDEPMNSLFADTRVVNEVVPMRITVIMTINELTNRFLDNIPSFLMHSPLPF